MNTRHVYIVGGIIAALLIITIVVLANLNGDINEQSFQQCIAAAGGYTADLDDQIAIRDMCAGYLP